MGSVQEKLESTTEPTIRKCCSWKLRSIAPVAATKSRFPSVQLAEVDGADSSILSQEAVAAVLVCYLQGMKGRALKAMSLREAPINQIDSRGNYLTEMAATVKEVVAYMALEVAVDRLAMATTAASAGRISRMLSTARMDTRADQP